MFIIEHKKRTMSLAARKALAGFTFVLPFLIGFIVFFAKPLVQSIIFSFSKLEITSTGYQLYNVGWNNYYQIFFVDPNFRRQLLDALLQMVTNVPLIVIFSFFAANLLNQKFKGRAIARSIFFIPVILSTGIINAIDSSDLMMGIMRETLPQELTEGAVGNIMGQAFELRELLYQTKIDPGVIDFIVGAVDRIYQIVSSSGVQILIFLAGLQSIPPSLFEASNIEGATGWENFWKITFPMTTPLILVNTVYTIIDSFTNSANPVMDNIRNTAFIRSEFGMSVAMAWSYFVMIIIILAVITIVFSRHVFYHE
ncbi:MAG TPA: sugar ABC transporter permease [Tissierellaceae bacterium]